MRNSRPFSPEKLKNMTTERIMATTYNNLYMDIRQTLRRAGIEAATLEARELMCFASGKTRSQLVRDGQLYVPPGHRGAGEGSGVPPSERGSRWPTSSGSGSSTGCRWTSPKAC